MSKTSFHNFRWGLDGSVQAMLVENGKVEARGPDLAPADAKSVDLQGKVLLPAFIDSHCHILPTGLDLAKLYLGHLQTKDDILEAVRERSAQLAPGEWLHAVHYDQNRLPGGKHFTRQEIDAVVADRPVLLRHWNGHASVANTEALRQAGVGPQTPDPPGGTFVRDALGELTGALLEKAHEAVTAMAPKPSFEQMVEAILAAGREMAKLGIACASDMMTGVFDLETELAAYREALERGCPIRIRLYLQWASVLGKRGIAREKLDEFSSGIPIEKGKIAGLKIFADGAIGSATAAIYGQFLTTEGKRSEDGKLMYSPERIKDMILAGHNAGYAIAVHSIGDRSTDHVLDAFQATGEAARHRIEHVMLLSDAQIERMARLGCTATMQPEFLAHFAYAYQRQLPQERLARLERFRSVRDAGIPLALNSDRPITPGDPWVGIRTAANRPKEFDPVENLTIPEAVSGYLEEASKANGDGSSMGTLAPGSVADFCLYSANPLEVESAKLEARWLGGESTPV